jgi:hypothetical protein
MVGRMTSLGLPRRAASANGSEGPMSATVARTGSGRPEATTGRFTVRVTHTLPFPAAAAMAPDVCDDCTTRFSQGGPSACRMGEKPTRGGPRSAGAAAAVASTHCCGSHFGVIPCMPTGGSPADRMPPRSMADAGDGVPYTVGGGLNTSPCMGDARGLTAGRLVQLPYKPNAVRRGVNRHQMLRPA